ncbi:pantoate--beta-alanine ligase [Flammeovirga sp. MY04]|uniref:pantoate--beta-alanine ligase n=1 Tax=Flammeovirga sp. MY04 TaxID=1191459 RepID=UPI0008253A06|nr:pantoate--beta-alanine ligase [Flammeovirga sp. MY04]ANQ48775.2 pantoate--beta-alanine ligase [Flammeovirga sp. MY04]
MDIFNQVRTLKNFINNCRKTNISVGFVPTMGALHDGHLTLIKNSIKENEVTICSIFVNPTQFNNAIDLKHYPIQHEKDFKLLEEAGCSAVFLPNVEEMYPNGVSQDSMLGFNFGSLETRLEGAFRPGHFNGVGIVVSKLFHMVQPDKAYFGLKDLQQYLIIKKMVKDLSFQIDIIGVPTVREETGLAMSSRNLRLKAEELEVAPYIYQTITKMKDMLKDNQAPKEVLEWGISTIHKNHSFHLEYLEIVSTDTLEKVDDYQLPEGYAIVIAAHLGKVRLIDNILVE